MYTAAFNLTLSTAGSLSVLLAQTTRIEQATSKVNFYLIILTCTFLVLAVLGLIARKLFNSPIESSDQDAALSLSDLRRMHREGELTDDEYLAARAAALAESGVYVSDTPSGNAASASATDPTDQDDAEPGTRPDTHLGAGPGVELGPELLDGPEEPPESEPKPDNPG